MRELTERCGERVVAVENSLSMKRELAQLHLHQAVLDTLASNNDETYHVPEIEMKVKGTQEVGGILAEAMPMMAGGGAGGQCKQAAAWLEGAKMKVRIECEFDADGLR